MLTSLVVGAVLMNALALALVLARGPAFGTRVYRPMLLNLALSFQAAYAAPFIMISQNRQADRDRHQAEEDYRTNVEAERRIEELQKSLAQLEVNKLDRILELLEGRTPARSPS